jgi:hypothetical protein
MGGSALQFAGGTHEPKTPSVEALQESGLAALGYATERLADAASLADCGNFGEAVKQLELLKLEIERAAGSFREARDSSRPSPADAEVARLAAEQAADR